MPGIWLICCIMCSASAWFVLDRVPDHLHVDLRRQAEVQNLAHHVCGEIVELRTRKLLSQLVAQVMGVFAGGPVFFGQRHQNVCVGGPTVAEFE